MMKFFLLLLHSILTMNFANAQSKIEDIAGDWVGSITIDQKYVAIHVCFEQDIKTRKLIGTYSLTSSSFTTGLKSSNFKKISFKGVSFQATDEKGVRWSFSLDKNELQGNIRIDMKSGKLRLVRIKSIPYKQIKEIEGNYLSKDGEFIFLKAGQFTNGKAFLASINFTTGFQRIMWPESKTEFFYGPGAKLPFPKKGVFSMTKDIKSRIVFPRTPVKFKSGNLSLSGVLIRPTKGHRNPAVVIVHGGGPQAAEDSFAIAYWFAHNGIVSLSYDKRGVGKSEGSWLESDLHELANDVVAGVEYLKEQPFINASKIGLFGFSQAGWVMPIASSKSRDISFLIPVVPSGVTMAEQEIYARGQTLKFNGLTKNDVLKARSLMAKTFNVIKDGTDEKSLLIEISKASKNVWFPQINFPVSMFSQFTQKTKKALKNMVTFDALLLWQKIKIPVFAIFGGLDQTVPTHLSKPAIEKALGNSQQKHKVVVFEKATHSMLQTVSGTPFEEALSPGYPSTFWKEVINWIKNK